MQWMIGSLRTEYQLIDWRRITQLGSAVMDLQRKLNHEIKEREIDENALSNRYEELHSGNLSSGSGLAVAGYFKTCTYKLPKPVVH